MTLDLHLPKGQESSGGWLACDSSSKLPPGVLERWGSAGKRCTRSIRSVMGRDHRFGQTGR